MEVSNLAQLTGDSHNMQAIFDALPGNSLLLKADESRYTILAVTPGYLKQTGHTFESMVGKGLFEAFPINDADTADSGFYYMQASCQQVITQKKTQYLPELPYNQKNKDGFFTKYYGRVTNSPVLGEDGVVEYVIHTLEDVTYALKTKEQEEKTKNLQKEYSLFMSAPIAVNILYGSELIIQMANPLSLEIWDKGEEVIGQSLLKILPELVSQGYKDLVGKILKTGIPHHAYEQHVSLYRNGREQDAYFNWVIQPFYEEDHDEASGIITFANEVTEQVGAKKREAAMEQSFALATEIAKLGVFNIDLKTNIATYSQQVMDWFGFTQTTLPMLEILPKVDYHDQSKVAETLERSIAGEWDGRHDFVYRVPHPETGSVQYLRSIGQVLREDGIAVRISGIIRTKRHRCLHTKRSRKANKHC